MDPERTHKVCVRLWIKGQRGWVRARVKQADGRVKDYLALVEASAPRCHFIGLKRYFICFKIFVAFFILNVLIICMEFLVVSVDLFQHLLVCLCSCI